MSTTQTLTNTAHQLRTASEALKKAVSLHAKYTEAWNSIDKAIEAVGDAMEVVTAASDFCRYRDGGGTADWRTWWARYKGDYT